MADATTSTTTLIATDWDAGVQATQAGCGCCKAEVETIDDLVRELERRRDAIDARLAARGAR